MTAPVGERSVVFDPRLRDRRRAVRRGEGRRRLRRLQVGLGVAATGAGAWALALSPVLDVDRVEVRGALRTGAAVVEQAIGIDRGEAMVSVDVAAAANASRALPWVATAEVVRRWPGEVVVTVTERRPLATVVTADGSRVMVDADGRQLAPAGDDADRGLPSITGLAPPAELGAFLGEEAAPAVELAELLPAVVPGVAPTIGVEGDELQVTLRGDGSNQTLVLFGRADHLADKAEALGALVAADALTESPRPVRVDVRVPGAPVLTRAGG